MERRVSDRTLLDEFTETFCEVMEKHAKYIVCSGFVAIAHGRTRGTEDIDMIIEKISKEKFIQLHEDLIKAGFQCIQSDYPEKLYEEYLTKGISIRYTLKDNNFAPPEMEVKFVKDILDEKQLKERQRLPLTGLNIYFSSIESNIAFKEEYLGTEKDLEDARHLRIVYKGKLNINQIDNIKKDIIKFRKQEEDGKKR